MLICVAEVTVISEALREAMNASPSFFLILPSGVCENRYSFGTDSLDGLALFKDCRDLVCCDQLKLFGCKLFFIQPSC